MLEQVSDADLDFTPGGDNPTLGQLCLELGRTQAAYVESFKTLKIDFDAAGAGPPTVTTASLKAWFQRMDGELESILQSISDETVATQQVDRGDFQVPIHINLDLLREALLIFYGKASVYLKAMGKPLTPTWHGWFG